MAKEINEEAMLDRVARKQHFSKEEYPLSIKIIATAVRENKLSISSATEFAVEEAEVLENKIYILAFIKALKEEGLDEGIMKTLMPLGGQLMELLFNNEKEIKEYCVLVGVKPPDWKTILEK